MTERKTLDFVILAGLLREPRSGYDLAGWMARETSHYFAIGHSSIYPALSRLEREGLVRHDAIPSERGPARKVYALTESGRAAVLRWAAAAAAEREVRDEQLVQALCYGFLPIERALARLQAEKAGHERRLAMYEELSRELTTQLAAGAISRQAYLGTLLTIRRGIGTEAGYAAWCDDAAAILMSGPPSPTGDGSDHGRR